MSEREPPAAAAMSIDIDAPPADELVAEARDIRAPLPSDMPRAMARVIDSIDSFTARCGEIVCWITPFVFMAMVYEIVVRYAFTAPTLWAYDVSRMLYGALFMLGAGYALLRGVHIRADFLYRNWSVRAQGVIDLTLFLLFYFPGLALFLWTAGEFFIEAAQRGERLDDTAWRPYAAPARAALWFGVLFLLIQGVSETLKALYAVMRGKRAR